MSDTVTESTVFPISLPAKKELEAFYDNLITALHTHNSADCQAALRQLFSLVYSTKQETCIPQQLIDGLVRLVLIPDKSVWQLKFLSSLILEEMSPSNHITLPLENVPWSESQVPYMLNIIFSQASLKPEIVQFIIPQLVRWISTVGFPLEVQSSALSSVAHLVNTHFHMLNKEHVYIVGCQLAEWLRHASIHQASNPYSRSLFKKDGEQIPVVEIDGTVTKNFFTILCIGQYYTDSQFLNIQSFSLLRPWLLHAETASVGESGGMVNRSTSSLVSVDSVSSIKTDSVTETALQYSIRIIDQCDRKPKMSQDFEVMQASLVEAVYILDSLCQADSRLITRVFETVKKLYTRTSESQPRVLLAIMQFFLNHSEAVVYDGFQLYELYFSKIVSTYYNSSSVAFDTCVFLQDNLATLCYRTSLLSKYFPNLLKILAWNPRTYVSEFVELLPAFISSTTVLEVFHSLLELPCLTAALQLYQRASRPETSLVPNTSASLNIPNKTLQDFNDPMYVPLFNFITRVEGGFGDTINKLNTVHSLLQPMVSHPRVVVCADSVPVLLRVFFDLLMEEGNLELANNLIPVLLERSGLLYNIPSYQKQVHSIFSEYLVLLFKKYPCLVVEQVSEILDFIGSVRNITDGEDFFLHVIWVLGEYLSATYDNRCTPEVVTMVYEQLETLGYEFHGMIQLAAGPDRQCHSSRILTIMMSTLAKLASRSQDLIPRVMLCLTKLGQLPSGCILDEADRQAIGDRATELLSLLKLPNIAAVILSPNPEINTGRWHRDSSSLPILLQNTNKLLHQ